jgi:hypothetical protein
LPDVPLPTYENVYYVYDDKVRSTKNRDDSNEDWSLFNRSLAKELFKDEFVAITGPAVLFIGCWIVSKANLVTE